MTSTQTSRHRFPLFSITLGVLLSAVLLPFSHFIGFDGIFYARMGENILSGRGISVNPGEPYTSHGFFYALLLGLVNLLFRDSELSGHLVSILAFSLAVIPLFLLSETIYGRNTASWISFLYVTHGFLLIHSNMVLTEPLFTCLILLEVYFVQKAIWNQRLSLSGGIAIGIISGLAYLTRPEGLFFYLASVFALFLFSTGPLLAKSRILSASVLTFALFFLPLTVFHFHHSGRMQLSSGVAENLIMRQLDLSHPNAFPEAKKIFEGLTEDKSRLKMDELKESFRLSDYLTKDNAALLRSFFPSLFWRLLGIQPYLYGGLGLLLIGAGLFHAPWDQQRKRAEAVFLIYLLTFLPQAFGFFQNKRYYAYLPFLLIWIGQGITATTLWTRQTFSVSARVSSRLGWTFCLALAFASGLYLHRTYTQTQLPFEYKELGLWMKGNIPDIAEQFVVSRHPSVNFYAGAKILHPPFFLPYVERFDDLLTYMRHQKARYFVVSDDLEVPALDAYRFLLDESKPPPFGILRKHTVTGMRKLILYELLRSEEG